MEVSSPGPIDNTPLLKDPGDPNKLKPELRENYDYFLVPQAAYKRLVSWHGGGPTIIRSVVGSSQANNLRIDLYPLRLLVVSKGASPVGVSGPAEYYASRDLMVKELTFSLCSLASSPPAKNRLWFKSGDTWELAPDPSQKLSEAGIDEGTYVNLETQGADGTFPSDKPKGGITYPSYTNTAFTAGARHNVDTLPPVGTVTYSSGAGAGAGAGANAGVDSTYGRTTAGATSAADYYREKFKNQQGETIKPGLCGLSNLGNTCFMNSALQCLSNTVPLTNFFTSEEYKADLNRSNPLGSKGFLADYFGSLVMELWSSQYRSVAPTNFKQVLGRFAPQFSGYQQHDSQELLAFLLDGLHEDLNRVVDKPYVESVESNGRSDEIVAAESWEAHLKRNKSIIVDLFQGQFKSTVVCPVCDRVSITFDPFMYLSLPLPVATERTLEVVIMYRNRPPRRHAIKVPIHGIVTDIKKAIAKVTHLGTEQMGICDIHLHKICKILTEDYSIKAIRDSDETYCFEIVANDDRLPPEKVASRKAQRALEREDRKRQRSALRLKKQRLQAEAAAAQAGEAGVALSAERMETDSTPAATATTEAAPSDVEMKETKEEEETDPPKADKGKEKVNTTTNDDGNSSDEEGWPKPTVLRSKYYMRYISVVHRELRVIPMSTTRRFETFGFPFVYSVDLAFVTNRQLYEQIWAHVRDIYSKGEVAEESPEEKEARLAKIAEKEPTSTPEEMKSLRGQGEFPFTLSLNSSYYISPSSLKPVPLNDEVHGREEERVLMFVCDWTDYGVEKYYNKLAIQNDESLDQLKKEKRGRAIPLSACLELFMKQEKLSAEDAWYCSKCAEHREATKKFDLYKLPKILVVHLKRFQFTRQWRDKLETLIDFPEELDMTPYVVGSSEVAPRYKLYAVSNHSGSMGFGHYTAYALNKNNQKWYCFNDSHVSEASEKEIVSSSAYLLFYERQDVVDTQSHDFTFKPEAVEEVYQSAKEEIEAQLAKDRKKREQAMMSMGGGAGASTWITSRARVPAGPVGFGSGANRLDDIDDSAPSAGMIGPQLPGYYAGYEGKGKELALVPGADPMDVTTTTTTTTAAAIAANHPAGYMEDEESEESNAHAMPGNVSSHRRPGTRHFDPTYPGGVPPIAVPAAVAAANAANNPANIAAGHVPGTYVPPPGSPYDPSKEKKD
eukprot:TRINITY_DN8513_c0_g1_i1.p1 TRINITY_DN8513_c0_g1~~TRINITY_DN8513_c0_g1_i1.p1  ORF type:complete len:1313 (+),score=298.81 TRINITY_DN8513_c0_g1_i1:395-3940(+)